MQDNSDFIPAPAASGNTAAASSTQGTVAGTPPVNISLDPTGLGTTQLIIGVAIIVIAAAVLFFVRTGIRNTLTSARATVEAANFAATLWYVFLLVLTALLVFGILGGLFKAASFVIAVAALTILGFIICGLVTSNARRTRK